MVSISDLPGISEAQSQRRNMAVGLVYLVAFLLIVPYLGMLAILAAVPLGIILFFDLRLGRKIKQLPGVPQGPKAASVVVVGVLIVTGFVFMTAGEVYHPTFDLNNSTESSTPSEAAAPTATEAATEEPTTTTATAESTATTEPMTTTGPPPTVDPTATREPTATPEPTPTSGDSGADEIDSPIDGGTARLATITRVVDGDTVEVEFENGETDTIRLIGVDTPETIASNQDPSDFEGIPDNTEGRDWLLNWGQEAKEYAGGQLDGQQVRVVTDPEGDRRGSYGRLLAYIYTDGSNFNRLLIENGLARMYDSQFTLRSEFESLESNAQNADQGLWAFESSDTPTPTESAPPARTGDQDCGDFDTQQQAQEFFEANNPAEDPHRLDQDGDGSVCESLP